MKLIRFLQEYGEAVEDAREEAKRVENMRKMQKQKRKRSRR